MVEVTAGPDRYVIRVARGADGWTASAERADRGDPFGVPQQAPTEAEAVARMGRWLRWQAAHAEALAELRRAEHAYHRVVTGHAFAEGADEEGPRSNHRDLLGAIDAARIRLDTVRAQRPV